MSENVLIAFGLTLFAGLSTGIGSALAFFTKRTNVRFLSFALGFSAGVMIYVSFVEIFFKAKDSLVVALGEVKGTWLTVAAFFGGILLIGIIDKLIPSFENPHEIRNIEEMAIEYHHNIAGHTSQLSKFLNFFEKEGFKYQIDANYIPLCSKNIFQDVVIYFYKN